MTDEMFDIVDEQDRVIGQLSRAEVHAQRHLHRAVQMFVFNTAGQLLLQMRSTTKDQYPSCYTSSASGHVDAGEQYDVAAQRELREELGLSTPLTRLEKFPASHDTAHEFTVLYETTTDDSPVPDPHEIAGLEWHTLAEITTMLEAEPEHFSPPFRVVFTWYCAHRGHPG